MNILKKISQFLMISIAPIFYLLLEYNRFILGEYGFHDLGLNSDFLSNTSRGELFLVRDYGINHLEVNFSLSLIPFTILYRIFESQLITLFISNLSITLTIFIIWKILNFLFLESEISRLKTILIFVFIYLIFNFNYYTYSALSSGTYVPLFTFFSMIYIWLLLIKNSRLIVFLLLIFILNLRQDAGIYMFFNIISVGFIQRKILTKKERDYLIFSSLISLVYVVIASFVLQPYFGKSGINYANKFWAHYGNNWSGVVLSMITNPTNVITDYIYSGFFKWIKSYSYFWIFAPLVLFFNAISGILFFTASVIDRNHLLLYNPSFLIPGMLLAVISSMRTLSTKFKGKVYIFLFFIAIGTYFLYKNILSYIKIQYTYNNKALINLLSFQENQNRELIKHFYLHYPQIKNVSADFHNFVFLNNSTKKYLINNRNMCDAIILRKGFSEIGSESLDKKNYLEVLSSEGWNLVLENEEGYLFIRNNASN